MIVHLSQKHDPYYHLALMEYLLKHTSDDVLLVFENVNAIIVGRHQNTYAEVNSDFIKKHQTRVVRRLAGGGAVYQDTGNISYVFITQNHFNDFSYFVNPLLNLLKAYGIHATFSGRNDILVDGLKIGGNAQSKYKNRTLHGGTILFDADLSKIEAALLVNPLKLASKGVKSVRSRITNIKPYLDSGISKEMFKARFIDTVIQSLQVKKEPLVLTNEAQQTIDHLIQTRYKTNQWNYGESPRYNIKKSKRFPFGQVDIYLTVKKATIKGIHIYTDALMPIDFKTLEAALTNTAFNKVTCANVLTNFYTEHPNYPIDKTMLLTILFDHEERYYV